MHPISQRYESRCSCSKQRRLHTIGARSPASSRNNGRSAGERRLGATDPINSMLNYGYWHLSMAVWRAIEGQHLHPFLGFLHTSRHGGVGLVYDAMEEFRPALVDRAVLAMVGRGTTVVLRKDGRLSTATRRRVDLALSTRCAAPRERERRRNASGCRTTASRASARRDRGGPPLSRLLHDMVTTFVIFDVVGADARDRVRRALGKLRIPRDVPECDAQHGQRQLRSFADSPDPRRCRKFPSQGFHSPNPVPRHDAC